MLGHRQLSATEYLAIWRRRWKLALVSLLFGSAAGFSLARLIPPSYVSTATVAETRGSSYRANQPGREFTASQLSALSQQVLTPERMRALAARYGLSSSGRREHSGDGMAQLGTSVAVLPAEAGFTVSFSDANPRTAQQVCGELASLFLQEELKNRQRDTSLSESSGNSTAGNDVTDFLARQVAEAKRNLDEREAKLAEFRRQHAAEFSSAERNATERKIADDEAQLQATDAALKSALQQRTALTESLFAQQSTALRTRKPVETTGTEALEEQLAAEQAQLVTLETRYTPDHPDVVKLRSDIEQLQKRIEQARKTSSENAAKKPEGGQAIEPGPTTQLQAQIHELDVLIQEKTREQGRLQQEILMARARLNTNSILDEEYRELTAESGSARAQYSSLLAKQGEAQKAAASEARQQAEPLRVTVPPNLPERPAYPNPLFFTLGGAGSGIAIGLLAIFAGEMNDKSMRTAGDVRYFLELPTLAAIPTASVGDERGGDGGRMGNQGEKEESVLADV